MFMNYTILVYVNSEKRVTSQSGVCRVIIVISVLSQKEEKNKWNWQNKKNCNQNFQVTKRWSWHDSKRKMLLRTKKNNLRIIFYAYWNSLNVISFAFQESNFAVAIPLSTLLLKSLFLKYFVEFFLLLPWVSSFLQKQMVFVKND